MSEQTKSIELREEVAKAIDYFIGSGGFLDELTYDKKYYTEKLIEYAQESQREIMRLRYLLTNVNTELFKIRDVYKRQQELIENQQEFIELLRSKLSL